MNDSFNNKNSEYKGLIYKTPGNVIPQGKPRVYFCCHDADFDYYFETITDEIIKIHHHLSFWYYDPLAGIPSGHEFFADLNQMQLFVIPVTSRFLYQKNQARELELVYALENHIPILPLMQEDGLEEDFNKICGDLHSLNKNGIITDVTALPYEEKLKNFLNAVLVSDEMAKRIRDAFVAYIFLSYRKKDRQYAQEIMRLIHDNESVRDVAIWYDEFLRPGDNFKKSIELALKKSEVFTMVVTNNVINEPNYVMSVEYPLAIKEKKVILPIEAEETNLTKMTELFPNLPEFPQIISKNDQKKLFYELETILRGKVDEKKDSSPEHLFLMGLAYLSGIDVEINHNRALDLIIGAAEKDYPEAYKKLVFMYSNGEGVKKDFQQAIRWQNLYVKMLESSYSDTSEKNIMDMLMLALWNLGDMYYDSCEFDLALKTFCEREKYAIINDKKYSSESTKSDLVLSFHKLGEIYSKKGQLNKAKDYYLKSFKIGEKIFNEKGNFENGNYIFADLFHLGGIYYKKCEYDEAEDYYKKCLNLLQSQTRNEEREIDIYKNDLAACWYGLANIYVARGKLIEADEFYHKSLKIVEQLWEETYSIKFKEKLIFIWISLGNLCEERADYKEAKRFGEKALEFAEDINNEIGTIQSQWKVAECLTFVGHIYKFEGNFEAAREYFQKSYDVEQIIHQESNTIESRQGLFVRCYDLGDICLAEGKYEEAKGYYIKSLKIAEEIAMDVKEIISSQNLLLVSDRLGKIFMTEGNLDIAEEHYRKGFKIAITIFKKTRTIESRRDLSVSFSNLGQLYEERGKFTRAKHYYKRGYKIDKQVFNEIKSTKSMRDMLISTLTIGRINENEGNLKKAKECYIKSWNLAEKIYNETGTHASMKDLLIVLENLGNLHKKCKKLEEAKDYYKKSLKIAEELYEQLGTLESKQNLSRCLEDIGELYAIEKNIEMARNTYERSLKMINSIYKELGTLSAYENLAFSYLYLGELGDINMMRNAYEIFIDLIELCPEISRYKEYRDTLKDYI